MGQQRVVSHTRRTASGQVVRVDNYQRTGFDRLRQKTPLEMQRRRKRKNKRGPIFSPKRAGRRLRRAFDYARKRRKTTAAVLALGGIGELLGFVATRGTGALVMGIALALTVLAGGLLAASGAADTEKKAAPRRSRRVVTKFGPMERAAPRGAVPRPRARPKKGSETDPADRQEKTAPEPKSRRLDGAPETDRDRAYFDAQGA